MLTAKPALAAERLARAHAAGITATYFTADDVYGSRAPRRSCRELLMGYAIAMRSKLRVTTPGGLLNRKNALAKIPA
jgi:SRSO17 transposase